MDGKAHRGPTDEWSFGQIIFGQAKYNRKDGNRDKSVPGGDFADVGGRQAELEIRGVIPLKTPMIREDL